MDKVKLRPKRLYKAIVFDGTTSQINTYLKENGMRFLDMVNEEDYECYIVYYVDKYKQGNSFEAEIGWFIYIDEFNEINSCCRDYAYENYYIIDPISKGKILSLREDICNGIEYNPMEE